MKTSPHWLRVGAVSIVVLTTIGCTSEARESSSALANDVCSGDGTDTTDDDSGGQTGSEAPDYDAAFPQDRVARLDIAISPDEWQKMLDDMTKQLGAFGQQGGLPRGGAPGAPGGGLPADLTAACSGLSAGAACEASFLGSSTSGTCTDVGGSLICAPAGGPGGPGAPGDAGGSVDLLAETPIYVECDVTADDRSWKHVGIRFKGNSSLATSWQQGIYKLPLRLKFDELEKRYPEIAGQRFYGFKNLNLSNNSSDPSLLREKLGNELFLAAGFAAPASAFYRVYVDHGDGPQYFGLYTGIELPSDKAFLETHFGSNDGNLYKPDGTGATFASWVQDSLEKENNESAEDYSDVRALFDALHADRSDAESWRAGLQKVFDVDTFLHWLALNTVIQNWDAYGRMSHNYYLYANPQDDGKLAWIPWDQSYAFSESMGGFPGTGMPGGSNAMPAAGGFGGSTPLDQSSVGDGWPLIRFLIDDPVYRATYDAYVAQATKAEYTPEICEKRFREAHDLIAPYVVGDQGEVKGYSFLDSEASFNAELDVLIAHVRKRQDDVAAYLSPAP